MAGYELKENGCVWKGVVKDPTISNNPAGGWTATGNVKIDPTLPGAKSPGAVEFIGGTCSTTAGLNQTLVMPPYDLAEPLALEVAGTGRCELPPPFTTQIPCIRPLGVGIGERGIDPLAFFFGPQSTKVCLGERAYGATYTLKVFPQACGGFTKSNQLDHLDIVPAPECPVPGKVTNGDFEGVGGWSVGGTGAEVAPSVGNKSSRGGRLHHAKKCDSPSLSGAFSVKTSEPAKPALAFTVKGKTARKMAVNAGTQLLTTITGTSVYENVSICLSEYMKGMASSLVFIASDDMTGGVCGDADDYEFIVDDVAIVSDPTCEDTTLIVDGGFERSDVARYWSITENGGSASFLKGAAARTGNGYASLSQFSCEKGSSFSVTVMNPGSVAGKGGPAIEYYYRASNGTAITYTAPGGTLTPTTTWTRGVGCLSPRRGGFPQSVSFTVSAGESCGVGTLSLDDLKLVQDPSCPE